MEIGGRRFMVRFTKGFFMVNQALEIPPLYRLFCKSVINGDSVLAKELAPKLREMLQSLPEDFSLEDIPVDKRLSVLILHTRQAQQMLVDLINELEGTLK